MAEGSIQCTLRIGLKKVEFTADNKSASHKPKGMSHELEMRLYDLERARGQRAQLASQERETSRDAKNSPPATESSILYRLGQELTQCFLIGEAGEALNETVKLADSQGVSCRLALEIVDDDLNDLPWETLRLPEAKDMVGTPLVLHPNIYLHRIVGGLDPVSAQEIPRPLRILVAVGSPEENNERGELLDYERELSTILNAVDEARQKGDAYVHILENGTVKDIREALEARRYHVLYITSHGAPGYLLLEDDEGRADLVDAERFCKEAIPTDRGVPLIVLAGCSTALEGKVEETVLPAVARELLKHGAPAVAAMQASVSDPYATEFAGVFFRKLTVMEQSDPLAAFSKTRQEIDQEYAKKSAKKAIGALAEWATPSLYLRGLSRPLFNPNGEIEKIDPPAKAQYVDGVVTRGVGEFVGRRTELRRIGRALGDNDNAGVLIHGIGGVGKSTLATKALFRLVEKQWIVVSLASEIKGAAVVIEAVGERLFSICMVNGFDEKHPLRQVAVLLKTQQYKWQDRFKILQENVLPQVPMALLLDNFEDNLDKKHKVKDESLAELLSMWARNPGLSRLMITCRYPFDLPKRAHNRLDHLHLGPLSIAEMRKLIMRLPGIDGLPFADKRTAYEKVGGHPRALEYLDALLRGGKARFNDVQDKMDEALEKKGIDDPGKWCADKKGNFDAALAETITLATDDVLLQKLLERVDEVPPARELLLGASVYRLPVDAGGLDWQVGREIEGPEKEKREKKLTKIMKQIEAAKNKEEADLGLSVEEIIKLHPEIHDLMKPPLTTPDGFDASVEHLLNLTLLSPVQYTASDEPSYIVHRWTAEALQTKISVDNLKAAHLRAGRYWHWRARVLSHDLEEYMEARYHLHSGGDTDTALAITGAVCKHLDTSGAWQREESLCLETLSWLEQLPKEKAEYLHQLGIIAQNRGSYDEALDWYKKSLKIKEELGNFAGVANSYGELGNLSFQSDKYDEALDWYKKSLEIKEELGNRAGMARSYHQLGTVAQERGSYDEALDWYKKSLAIKEELGNRSGMANSYGQLGNLSYLRGIYDEALDWYKKSLAIFEELGDRSGMAKSYHHLGIVAQMRGSYDEALEWYKKSLAIAEELGNRSGMANSYGQLGHLSFDRGSYDEALVWYKKSLALDEELGNRSGMAKTYHNLGTVAEDRGSYDEALEWYKKSLAIEEELGNRGGMASSYHQLGMVAEDRGSYDEALEWYKKSLKIKEEIGNRGGTASTFSQIGIHFTEHGNVEKAIPYNLKSLAIRIEIGVPQARIDLHWLLRQKEALGESRFGEVVEKEVGKEQAENLSEMMEQYAKAKAEADESGDVQTGE